jgi:hypothetical protein
MIGFHPEGRVKYNILELGPKVNEFNEINCLPSNEFV